VTDILLMALLHAASGDALGGGSRLILA